MTNRKNDRTEEIIHALSKDLSAKGHLNFGVLFLSWSGLLVSGFLIGYVASILMNRSVFPGWWPEPALVIAWGILTSFFLTKSAYPEENSVWLFWGAGGSLFLWIGFHLVRFIPEFKILDVHIGLCPLILVLTAAAVGGFGRLFLKGMASARPGLAAFLFLSFTFAASNLALKFICPDQSAPHIFLSHVFCTLAWIFVFWFPLRKKFSW